MAFSSEYLVVQTKNNKRIYCETLKQARIILAISGGEIIANYDPKTITGIDK